MSREAWIAFAIVAAAIALITVVGAFLLARRLFATKRALGQLGADGKITFYGALIYTIFPIDLLPDPIYLDDMAVLGGSLFYLTKLLRARRAQGPTLPHSRASAGTSAPARKR